MEWNQRFFHWVNPESVLDVYAGPISWYAGKDVKLTSNDYNQPGHTYAMDASRLCAMMYAERRTFDLVDLDPYGSAFDCFENALRIARHGLIITFGELGHKRWKRLDFVSRTYRIHDLNQFTLDALCDYVQEAPCG